MMSLCHGLVKKAPVARVVVNAVHKHKVFVLLLPRGVIFIFFNYVSWLVNLRY
jgi:hypothetical protein